MIAVICAMEVELERILQAMEHISRETVAGVECTLGTLEGCDAVAAVCSVGKVSAAQCTQAILSRYAPQAVFHSGIAGAVAPDVGHMDVVCARELTYRDVSEEVKRGFLPMGGYFLADPRLVSAVLRAEPECKLGCIATGDLFVSSAEEKKRLWEDYHALCADMESAAVAQVCTANRTPFAVIRCISDLADGDAHEDYASFERAAAEKSANILRSALKSITESNILN